MAVAFLLISTTLSATTSEARSPAPQATRPRSGLAIQLRRTASNKRETSYGLRTSCKSRLSCGEGTFVQWEFKRIGIRHSALATAEQL